MEGIFTVSSRLPSSAKAAIIRWSFRGITTSGSFGMTGRRWVLWIGHSRWTVPIQRSCNATNTGTCRRKLKSESPIAAITVTKRRHFCAFFDQSTLSSIRQTLPYGSLSTRQADSVRSRSRLVRYSTLERLPSSGLQQTLDTFYGIGRNLLRRLSHVYLLFANVLVLLPMVCRTPTTCFSSD